LSSRVDELTRGTQKVYDLVGKQVMRDNTKMYFEVLDSAFGVRRVAFKQGASYMKSGFLLSLARVFSNHEDFWRGEKLFVEAPLLRKIAQFPYSDPQIVQLASSGGKGPDILYVLMVDHINSGKRTRRLRPRIVEDLPEAEELEDEDPEGQGPNGVQAFAA
jgi:hypothetical protein